MKFSAILAPVIATACIAVTTLPAKADPTLTDGICPAVGTATGCNFLIEFYSNPSSVSTGPGSSPGTYDANGDQLVGVYNATDSTIYSFTLSSNSDIFGFTGNGIDGYASDGVTRDGNNPDSTGYGGPNAYFSGITGNALDFPEVGTVNFANGGILPGSTDYFSLSAPLNFTTQPMAGFDAPPLPEPASMALLGFGLVASGFAGRLRR